MAENDLTEYKCPYGIVKVAAKEYLFKKKLKDSVYTLDEAFKELIRINKEFENIISK
jgi:hypothetical protein